MIPNSEDFTIQRDRTTVANRYPEIFHPARRLCLATGRTRLRVLSFGCSTGYETYDLSTTYFPESTIIGLDISPEAIATARAERSIADRIVYDISTPETFAKYGPYDAIFAMSVLCRWPDLADMPDANELFPFCKFAEIVTLFDRHLVQGGVIVIYNANYNFRDTDLISKYEVMLDPAIKNSGYVKHFDRLGREVPDHRGTDVIFRKSFDPNARGDRRSLRIIDAAGRLLGTLDNSG